MNNEERLEFLKELDKLEQQLSNLKNESISNDQSLEIYKNYKIEIENKIAKLTHSNMYSMILIHFLLDVIQNFTILFFFYFKVREMNQKEKYSQ
jgi:hypothetical protein